MALTAPEDRIVLLAKVASWLTRNTVPRGGRTGTGRGVEHDPARPPDYLGAGPVVPAQQVRHHMIGPQPFDAEGQLPDCITQCLETRRRQTRVENLDRGTLFRGGNAQGIDEPRGASWHGACAYSVVKSWGEVPSEFRLVYDRQFFPSWGDSRAQIDV